MIRLRMKEDGLTFDDALREVAAGSAFTTHTPVAAGHDRFDAGLVEEHLSPLYGDLGLSLDAFMGLGRVDPHRAEETFCMTVLAFKTSRRANAVSNLHGVVTRRMWRPLWPWRSEEEIPIGHITNGVHVPTWLAMQIRVLYDKVLPPNWHLRTGEPDVWADFEQISPGELWETHEALKGRLIGYARHRLARYWQRHRPVTPKLRSFRMCSIRRCCWSGSRGGLRLTSGPTWRCATSTLSPS
jgi:starch phosphorylase